MKDSLLFLIQLFAISLCRAEIFAQEIAIEKASAAPISTVSPQVPEEMFRQLDANTDGVLSLAELLDLSETWGESRLRQWWIVFDLDHNQTLSRAEFLTLPGLIPIEARGPFADPFVDLIRKKIQTLLEPLSFPIMASQQEDQKGKEYADWDLDENGTVTFEEAKVSLEIAYGLRRDDGEPARSATGFVFNGSYFQHLDSNRDGMLSRNEFVLHYFAGIGEATRIFKSADVDANGQLTLTEIDAARLFRVDVPQEFLNRDQNRDGMISREELQQGAVWQRRLARHMLPAFDLDADEQLSLTEFLLSPLSNPLVNWTSLREDRNGDGVLSLAEFHSQSSPCGNLLAADYFRQLDRNGDQQLQISEFTFRLHADRLSLEATLSLYDQNQDGAISLKELFTPEADLSSNDSQSNPEDVLIPAHRAAFHDADVNHDGLLKEVELPMPASLIRMVILESQLRLETWPRFTQLDADNNGRITRSEWEAGATFISTREREQDFIIADSDEDEGLSFAEFASIPNINSVHQRPDVIDPIAEHVQAMMAELHLRIENLKSPLSASALVRELSRTLLYFNETDLIGWDKNSDGQYQWSEIQQGLERLYQLRASSGELLRRTNGQVFNLRTMQAADTNHDSRLSQVEFLSRYWKQGSAAMADFQHVDRDKDRQLSLSELLCSDLYWIDTQLEFRRFDADRNGKLSREELLQHSNQHEKRMVSLIFPAFDLNQDEALSFREYRLTPLSNPLHDYDSRRWDLNYDGQLSLLEFHRKAESSHQGIGLSDLFFQRLDLNRDRALSYAEMKFHADLKRAPSELAFQILDQNSDGRLQLAEVLARERPKDRSAWAKRHAEQRSMEVEDAFRAADADRNRVLSLSEFQAEGVRIRDVILGRDLQSATNSNHAASSVWLNFRTIAFIGFNFCLFLGLGWWRLKGG